MESKATLSSIARDLSGEYLLTFKVPSIPPNLPDAIKDICLRLTVKRWKEKRSLDANAYMWVLLGKLAKNLKTSSDELYELFLQEYGFLDEDEDGHIAITIRSRIDVKKSVPGHWRLYKISEDGKWKSYLKIKGTSEYNTKEMSQFLDMVVAEAKDQGIQTETPEELERIKSLWQRN